MEQRATERSKGNDWTAGCLQPFVEQEANFAEFTQDLLVRGEIRRSPVLERTMWVLPYYTSRNSTKTVWF